MEIWKKTAYEGYSVSSYGRVRADSRIVLRKDGVALHYKEPKMKTLLKNRKGYYHLTLSNVNTFGYRTHKLVHRLVAETFIPNPDCKEQVNHKNGVKTDNTVDNLEWVTNLENHTHKLENGLIPETHKPKCVGMYDLSGNLIALFHSLYSAGKSVGGTQYGVSRVVNGLRKTYKGHIWMYVEEGATTRREE